MCVAKEHDYQQQQTSASHRFPHFASLFVKMQPSSTNGAVGSGGMFFSCFRHMSPTESHVVAGQAESFDNRAQQSSENVPLNPANSTPGNENALVEFSVVVDMRDEESILDSIESLQYYLNLLRSRLASLATH